MLLYKTKGNPIELDMDKIIEGLEYCSQEGCDKECPYHNPSWHGTCQLQLHRDSLMLIKVLAGENEKGE